MCVVSDSIALFACPLPLCPLLFPPSFSSPLSSLLPNALLKKKRRTNERSFTFTHICPVYGMAAGMAGSLAWEGKSMLTSLPPSSIIHCLLPPFPSCLCLALSLLPCLTFLCLALLPLRKSCPFLSHCTWDGCVGYASVCFVSSTCFPTTSLCGEEEKKKKAIIQTSI